jgi:uncharacterized membrane protein
MWFLPTLMALAAFGLSRAMIAVDRGRGDAEPSEWFYGGGADGARAVLTSIAGSMIGIAGITFSITIVALTLASSQFGPRLQRNFMRDRGNQFVLGTYVATFLYCLVALLHVRSVEESLFVPHASITVGIVLALASLGVLIYFIHHVAQSIRASHVIELVGRDLDRAIARFAERGFGARRSDPEPGDDDAERLFPADGPTVEAASGGYVQAIDMDGLVEAAGRAGGAFRVARRPGHRVYPGEALVLATVDVPEEVARRVRGAFVLGSERTGEQDVEFAALQLVEVAVRALSPGINDPFTAIHCVDRLGLSVARLAASPPPPLRHRDEERTLRVVADFEVFEGFADAAFDQIRQHARGDVAVLIRLLETLEALGRRTEGGQRAPLRSHLEKTWRAVQATVTDPDDLADARRRYETARDALA